MESATSIGGFLVVPDPLVPLFTAADPAVEFARLLPITDEEAAFSGEHGWQALAALLVQADVGDAFRASVV
jgi:hypothetical protein